MIPFYTQLPKSSWGKLLALIPLFIIIGCSLNDQITGTVDETDTGIVAMAMLYKPDGTPADSATIKVFEIEGTTVAFETVTDSNGNFALAGLNGTYNIWAEKDSLVAFQDSVFIFPDTSYIESDTLGNPGSVTAKVGLEPGDDYQTVTVNVLGTHIHSNVDSDGWFTFSGMPEGEYNLRLSTTLPNYTTTFYPMNVVADSADTISDTLWLIYTGIPLVLNIEAEYDTLNGVMQILWDSVDYGNFQEYLVYRQPDTAKSLSTVPIGIVTENVFYDTIYTGDRQTGEYFLDTNTYTFQYRVKIRNKFDDEGKVYGYIRATAVPPKLVKTDIEFNLPSGQSDTLTINDTLRIGVSLENETRNLKSLSLAVADKDSIVKTLDLDSTKKVAVDTLKYVWAEEGTYTVYAINEDMGGSQWLDSIVVYVIEDLPTANAGTDTLVLTNTDINLHGSGSDGLGEIVKYEWAFGSTDTFYPTSTGDTTIKAPSSETDSYLCYLKVTDDDGKTDINSVEISAKKVFITAPTTNGTVSGVYKVYGTADPTLSEIQVKIAGNSWVKATGVDSWSADIETRLLYPTTSSTISIKAISASTTIFEEDLAVKISNPDPLIGCWSGKNKYGNTVDFCLYAGGGSTDGPLGIAWNFASGWRRNSATSVTVFKIQGNADVTVQFTDINTLIVSGDNTGTYIRQ